MASMKSLLSLLHESKDRCLFKNDHIEVLEKDGWYTYTRHNNGNGAVAVLGFVKKPQLLILGRFEETIPHDDGITLASLTGGVEEGEEFEAAATREFKEESGFDVDKEDLVKLGAIRPSKSSDQAVQLFAVELIDADPEKTHRGGGDGTRGEKNAFCRFVSAEDAINSKDPILITMVARLLSVQKK